MVEGAGKAVPRRTDLRHAQLPGGERVSDPRELLAETARGRGRVQRLRVRPRDDVDGEVPRLARGELHAPARVRPIGLTRAREDDLRACGIPAAVLEQA